MPKLKTRKAIAKRFRLSAGGKLRHGVAGKRHLRAGKTSQQRARQKGTWRVFRAQERALIKGIPSGA